MKVKALVFLLIVGSSLAAIGYAVQLPPQERAPLPTPFEEIAAAEGVIAINLGGVEEYQMLGIVDCQQRVMSVYHIDRRSGEISLQSVRNMTWDLQLDEFNAQIPSPLEVRDSMIHR